MGLKMKNYGIRQLIIVMFTWVLPVAWIAPAVAGNGMHMGKFDVDTAITVEGEFNDNIFWTDQNEEDDYIFTVTPSIALTYKSSPGNFINMGYTVDLVTYTDFDDNNYARHNPYLNLELNPPSGLYLKLNESYINTEDPYGSENEYGLGLSTKRWNNTLSVATGFRFAGKYGVEAGYRGFVERYDERTDEWENVDDNTFNMALFYQATVKTRLFCQYQYREVEYPEQNNGAVMMSGPAWSSATSQDNTQNHFYIGARFSPFSKISGEAKIGYANVRHDNDMDRNGIRYEDEDTWVAQTWIGYRVRERTRLSFVLIRSYKVSSDETADAPGYFDTLVRLGVEQKMRNRLKASLDLDWNTLDYQDRGGPEKFFDIYRIKACLTYDINRWLDAGIQYQFKNKVATRSAYEDDEYTINSIALTVTARY